MSDNTPAAPPFHSTASEKEITRVEKERAMEKVLAVEQALDKSTENPLKET